MVFAGLRYFSIGCETPECFAYIRSHPCEYPKEQAMQRLKSWNTRAEQ
jgi:hypothetical protein